MIYGISITVFLVLSILTQAGRACNDIPEDQPTFRENSFVNDVDPSTHQLAASDVNPWLPYYYDDQTHGRTLGGNIQTNQIKLSFFFNCYVFTC